MDVKILSLEKNEAEVEIGSLTFVEIFRVYLNKDPSVIFAAWKRTHPTEKPILKVKTKGKTAKKAIDDTIKAIIKDLDKVLADFKKMN